MRYPDNVAGRFYVTDNCIDCELCREFAPANFSRNKKQKQEHCYVSKQPVSRAELNLCLEVAEGRPVDAIIDSHTGRPGRLSGGTTK